MAIYATIGPQTTGVSGTKVSGEIVITIYDAATGQPTNGNNVTVYFTQNINGVEAQGQATIAGQRAAVYHGELSDSDPLNPYFTKFWIDSIGDVPIKAPPVNTCDLIINYINIDQPESAPGAADGQLTVYAHSSYAPISYSLDNVNFQTSPIFAGLSGGLKTAYVTDPNGCVYSS